MTSVIKVDNIQSSGGTAALEIDSSGRVLMPVKPSWRLGMSSSQSETTNGAHDVEFDISSSDSFCHLKGGCTLSSGVVTLPVAGVYHISANIRFDGIGSGYIISYILRNNNTDLRKKVYAITDNPAAAYESLNSSETMEFNAGDNVRIQVYVESDTSWNINGNSTFSGHLVG